ncbi:phosphoanhydride phosphohydrolase [Asaia siamensis]|uniref:Phosphoanhydride phosphohydrolase n=1 Tax=Asaia siamensis TaxID=110479 RepID=A0ABQ1MA32_9PROT|nr:histidine-type phosphatase [Asaia siamensis]GGC37247.1 phosphoanhydride phosphohydrolase [Asaia siamensis]
MTKTLLFAACLASLGLGFADPASAGTVGFSSLPLPDHAVLERVVLVARHGIRSPTHGPEALEKETGVVWPAWPVAPGQLTEHGRVTLGRMMQDIALHYDLACARHQGPCLSKAAPVIWADSADDRTRQSGQIMAETLVPAQHLMARSLSPAMHDPLFDAVTPEFIFRNRTILAAEAASFQRDDVKARPQSVDQGLRVLQDLIAPEGCSGGTSPCFSTPLTIGEKKGRAVLEGGPTLAASVAENILLVYVQGLENAGPRWAQALAPELLKRALPVHDYLSDLTRRRGTLVKEKSRLMADVIDRFLSGESVTLSDGSIVPRETRFLAFAGHDTTLDALAARYGLGWSFADQPDRTAPDTTLAFERWRDHAGHALYRVVIFHQSLAALRNGGGLDEAHGGAMMVSVKPAPMPVE